MKQNQETDHSALRSEGDLNITAQRQTWADSHLSEETRRLLEEDARYFLHQSLSTPCLNVMRRCEGAEIVDWDGRTLLDFHGNNVHQVGFANEAVIQAVTDQMKELAFCTRRYTNQPAIECAKALTCLAPGDLNRVLFAPGGSAAMGMALKLARAATGKHRTLSMWDSFHGASLDCISIGGEAIFRKDMGPLMTGSEHVPPPDPSHCLWECGQTCNLKCADYVEYVLKKEAGEVAAVIGETMRCTPFIPPPDYWKKIRRACDKYGALLILDEIPIALGRTGRMFACEHYDVVPDMLVLGKGLGGGLFPIAALLAREHLNLMKETALGHYTHEKSPIGCAATLATLSEIKRLGLLEHAESLGHWTLESLNQLKTVHPIIKDVRGKGLLIGVELEIKGDLATTQQMAEKVMYDALRLGLNFKITMGSILTLTPSLTITRDQMQRALDILDTCLSNLDLPSAL